MAYFGTVTRAAKHRPLCVLPEPAVNNAVQGVRKVPDAISKAAARLCWGESQLHNAGEGLSLVQSLARPARKDFVPTPGFVSDVFGTKFPQPIPVRSIQHSSTVSH